MTRFPLWLAVVCLIWTANFAHARTFKIATLAQNGTQWLKSIKAAASKIKEETEGRVAFKFYAGGVMGNDNRVLRKIRAGQLQGATLGTGVLSRFYGDLELYNLPMIFRNEGEVDYIRKQFDVRLRAGLEVAGFANFGFAEGGFAYAMTKQKVSSVAGIRRQRVWTPTDDEGALRAIQAFGISPIPLGIADVLLALQSGTLNAVAGPVHGALALQWHTQVKYLINLPLIYTYAMLIVDKKKFDAVDEADQMLAHKYMDEAFREIDVYNRQDQQAAFAAFQNQGVDFVNPTPEEVTTWRALAQKAVEATVASGMVTPSLYEEMYEHLKTYRKTSDQSKMTDDMDDK